MLFSNRPRTHFNNAPIHEVICQLRFPTILSIKMRSLLIFRKPSARSFPST